MQKGLSFKRAGRGGREQHGASGVSGRVGGASAVRFIGFHSFVLVILVRASKQQVEEGFFFLPFLVAIVDGQAVGLFFRVLNEREPGNRLGPRGTGSRGAEGGG